MTLRLVDVCDIDRVVSFVPLVVDVPSTERYARGAAAVLRRVLGAWIDEGRLLDLEGWTPDDRQLAQLRSLYARLAEGEDFVDAATVSITFVDGRLRIVGRVTFVDGRTYPLEVAAGDAAAALLAIGAL